MAAHPRTRTPCSLAQGISALFPAATLAEFTKKPPIDVDSVSKIKEAIANGEYPINLDAVADMLLDAYKEMKS